MLQAVFPSCVVNTSNVPSVPMNLMHQHQVTLQNLANYQPAVSGFVPQSTVQVPGIPGYVSQVQTQMTVSDIAANYMATQVSQTQGTMIPNLTSTSLADSALGTQQTVTTSDSDSGTAAKTLPQSVNSMNQTYQANVQPTPMTCDTSHSPSPHYQANIPQQEQTGATSTGTEATASEALNVSFRHDVSQNQASSDCNSASKSNANTNANTNLVQPITLAISYASFQQNNCSNAQIPTHCQFPKVDPIPLQKTPPVILLQQPSPTAYMLANDMSSQSYQRTSVTVPSPSSTPLPTPNSPSTPIPGTPNSAPVSNQAVNKVLPEQMQNLQGGQSVGFASKAEQNSESDVNMLVQDAGEVSEAKAENKNSDQPPCSKKVQEEIGTQTTPSLDCESMIDSPEQPEGQAMHSLPVPQSISDDAATQGYVQDSRRNSSAMSSVQSSPTRSTSKVENISSLFMVFSILMVFFP